MNVKNKRCWMVLAVLVGVLLCCLMSGAAFGALLKEGDRAPDFTLAAQDGSAVTLSAVWKNQVVVLYFYPKDDTPGCTKQACYFRDINQEYLQAGAKIIGVSVDDVESHRQFAQKHRLNFTLLADPEKKVTALYGVLSDMPGARARRITFVIDKTGTIRKVYPDVNVATHNYEVLEFVKKLQGGS